MSLNGWNTTNYLRSSSAVITGAPFTFTCWARLTASTGVTRNIFNIANTANINDRYNIIINPSNNAVFAVSSTATGGVLITGTTALDTTGTVWYHIACVGAAANSRTLYVNGVSEGTSGTSNTPAGLNQTNIGIRGGSANANPGTSIDIAELCVRNVALGIDDIAEEVATASALFVRPNTILAYYKLLDTSYLGNNLFTSFNCTLTGTLTTSTHPRISYPRGIVIP